MLKGLVDDLGYLVLDGATGSEIERLGHAMDPILWSGGTVISNPSVLIDIHHEYLKAGANIVTTASYQMSQIGFKKALGFNSIQTHEAYLKSIDLAFHARESFQQDGVAKHPCLIAASIGSYGSSLADGSEYSGHYSKTPEEMRKFHQPKFNALLSSHHADFIAFETIPCLTEVKAITQLLERHSPKVDSWCALACQSETLLNSGESLEDTIRYIEDAAGEVEILSDTSITSPNTTNKDNIRNMALGVNCTNPKYVESIIHTMKEFTHKDRILIAYPNNGDEFNVLEHEYINGTGCEDSRFAEMSVLWYEAGARVIGGCCKTTPSTIRAVKEALRKHVGK